MTYAELRDETLNLAYPGRMARNLIPVRQRHVISGLMELQNRFWRMKAGHVTTYVGEELYQCGALVTSTPYGTIRRVYAERDDVGTPEHPIDDPCACHVDYRLVGPELVEQFARDFTTVGGRIYNDNDVLLRPMLPVPNGAAVFAVDRNTLLAYPCPTTPWRLKIQWDGFKDRWFDTDELDHLEDTFHQMKDLLVLWVRWKGAGDDRNWQDAGVILAEYRDAVKTELLRQRRIETPEERMVYPEGTQDSPHGFPCNPCVVPYAPVYAASTL